MNLGTNGITTFSSLLPKAGVLVKPWNLNSVTGRQSANSFLVLPDELVPAESSTSMAGQRDNKSKRQDTAPQADTTSRCPTVCQPVPLSAC